MFKKLIFLAVLAYFALDSQVSFGMYVNTKRPRQSSIKRVQKLEPVVIQEPMVNNKSIMYALEVGADWYGQTARKDAIELVKKHIRTNIFDDAAGSLEFPTPASKISTLQKKVDILPWGVDYNDEVFTQACDELIEEIKNIERTPKEQEKDKAIDRAIVHFKKKFASSDNIYRDAINLMGPSNRALVAIALQQECKDCTQEQFGVEFGKKEFGKERYEQLAVESRRRAPMDEERKSSFEERKKALAQILSSKRGGSRVEVAEAAE
jgi:hypothetical protein